MLDFFSATQKNILDFWSYQKKKKLIDEGIKEIKIALTHSSNGYICWGGGLHALERLNDDIQQIIHSSAHNFYERQH